MAYHPDLGTARGAVASAEEAAQTAMTTRAAADVSGSAARHRHGCDVGVDEAAGGDREEQDRCCGEALTRLREAARTVTASTVVDDDSGSVTGRPRKDVFADETATARQLWKWAPKWVHFDLAIVLRLI